MDWLKNKGLEYRDGVLYFANMNTIEIAEKFGTPIYITSEEIIEEADKIFNVVSSLHPVALLKVVVME